MFKKLLFAFLMSNVVLPVAQTDSTQVRYDDSVLEKVVIEQDDLQKYRSDDTFDYEIEQVDNSWWDAVTNWFYSIFRRLFEWLFGIDKAPAYLAIFLKVLPYVLLGLLLYLIIRFFMNANSQSLFHAKQQKNLVSLSEEERIIKSEDINALIRKAVDAKDYRLAIRYYYLLILQQLSESERIDWKPQKTNYDYLQELSDEKFKNMFAKVTLLYDYVWYGEFVLAKPDYDKASATFENLQLQLKNG